MTALLESFAFYGTLALLVFYMVKGMMVLHSHASHVYGLFMALVCFTPFFGGILADRFLGQRKTVLMGEVLMCLGYCALIFEALFYPALILLILGSGAFSANISAQVGILYEHGDPRRDRAYGIYYLAINIGAFFAPLVCGALGEIFGWKYGFGAAALAMTVSLGVYLRGGRYLPPDGIQKETPEQASSPKPENGKRDMLRMAGLIIISLVTVLFWAAYEQQGNVIALWTDRDTDRFILGWEVPATWFQSLNPLFVFLFMPLLTAFWGWRDRRGHESSSLGKMAVGCFLASASFILLANVAKVYEVDGIPVSMFWLIGFNALLTFGELYLVPVGLSFVTKIAPARMVSMSMGIMLMSEFLGNWFAGYLGSFWESWTRVKFFEAMAGMALLGGVLILCLLPWLKRMTSESDPPA